MGEPDIRTRLCFKCRVRWDFDWRDVRADKEDPRDCPSCGADAFFTCNPGDIGTCMHLVAANLTIDDFSDHEPHQGRGGGDASENS